MQETVLLIVWTILVAVHLGEVLRALRGSRKPHTATQRESGRPALIPPRALVIIAMLTALAPTATMILAMTMIVSGSSNVAQLNTPAEMQLWHLWSDAWIPLLLGNAASIVLGCAACVLFWRWNRKTRLWAFANILGLITPLLGLAWLSHYFPDA